jgi:hypothetical protein
MKARTALLELFKESGEWRSFFRSCCETSASRLRSRAWQFRVKLKERGHGFPTEEVEDVLLGLARELLPDTAAANVNVSNIVGLVSLLSEERPS